MQKDDLEMGLDNLLSYLDDPELHQAELEIGLDYLRQHPDYEDRIEALIQALEAVPQTEDLISPAKRFWISWRRKVDQFVIEFSSNVGPSLQLTPQTRSLKGIGSTLWEFSFREAMEDLQFRVETQEKEGDPTRCLILVDFLIPDRGPLNHADTEVTLKRDEQILATKLTDYHGKVLFEDIPVDELAQLVLEITPPDCFSPDPSGNDQ